MGDTTVSVATAAPSSESVRLCAPGLLLRPFEPADAVAFAAAVRESSRTVGRWMGWCTPDYTAQQALAWFDVCAKAWADGSACEFGLFAEQGGEFLGGGGLNLINRQHNYCNLGYWVRESRQRQGIASRAAGLLADYGLTRQGFTRIEIVVAEGNEPSHGVARKAGAEWESLARNRLVVGGVPVAASMFALLPRPVPAP